MTCSRSISNTTHTYMGDSEINFFSDDLDGLSVTIDTERLHIRSVEATEADYNHYAALFGNKNVMEKFATGQTITKDAITKRVKDIWVKRWHESDPFAGLAVFKKFTDEFLGHVILGHGDKTGESELAYLFNQRHWGKRFGSETVAAVVKEYAPATVWEGYLLEGKPLEKIVATSRPDNIASVRILEKVGMQLVDQEEKYGKLRYHYSIDLSELQKKIQ
jgi:RimJ/RimL family protein N-acetyltransferase